MSLLFFFGVEDLITQKIRLFFFWFYCFFYKSFSSPRTQLGLLIHCKMFYPGQKEEEIQHSYLYRLSNEVLETVEQVPFVTASFLK